MITGTSKEFISRLELENSARSEEKRSDEINILSWKPEREAQTSTMSLDELFTESFAHTCVFFAFNGLSYLAREKAYSFRTQLLNLFTQSHHHLSADFMGRFGYENEASVDVYKRHNALLQMLLDTAFVCNDSNANAAD